jgi:nucleotide-binding universal stress UspA family protein
MKKVLIAVDDTKDLRAVLFTFYTLVRMPEEVILLNVQRLEGKSLMIDMLGQAELGTLKEAVEGTAHKEEMDRRSAEVLNEYRRELQNSQFSVKTVVREGAPGEEILKVSEEEDTELIILGSNGRRGISRLISGSVAGEVKKNARIPVYVAKTNRIINERFVPILFLLFWSVISIYYISALLMDAISKKLSSSSEDMSVLVSYYIVYLAAVMIFGIFVAVIGGIFGRLFLSNQQR